MARSDAEYMTASIIPLLKNLLFLSLAYTLASIYDGHLEKWQGTAASLLLSETHLDKVFQLNRF